MGQHGGNAGEQLYVTLEKRTFNPVCSPIAWVWQGYVFLPWPISHAPQGPVWRYSSQRNRTSNCWMSIFLNIVNLFLFPRLRLAQHQPIPIVLAQVCCFDFELFDGAFNAQCDSLYGELKDFCIRNSISLHMTALTRTLLGHSKSSEYPQGLLDYKDNNFLSMFYDGFGFTAMLFDHGFQPHAA